MVNPTFHVDKLTRRQKQSISTNKRNKIRVRCSWITIQDFMPIRDTIIIRQRMSLAKKGRQTTATLGIKRAQYIKDKLKPFQYTKENSTGTKNPFYGKEHNEITKNIIRKKAILRWQNPDYRKNLVTKFNTNGKQGKHFLGKPKSQEQIERFKESMKDYVIRKIDTKPEKMMQLALMLHGIKFIKHKSFKIGKSWHQVDIFIEPNIVVEVDGVHWHLPIKQYKRDLEVNQTLNIQGYHVIRIRDKDIVNDVNICAMNVINLIKECQYNFKCFGVK